MLETLNKYSEDQATSKGLIEYIRWWLVRERRFARLLALSIVFHIAFYISLIVLNSWAMRQIKPLRGQPSEFVVITEIAPPSSKFPALRSAPEPQERADVSQLQYNPETANDTDLLSRSPKPSLQRGNNGELPTPEAGAHGASPGTGNKSSGNQAPAQTAPPVIASVQPNRATQPSAPFNASVPSAQPAPLPPAPAPNTAEKSQGSAQAGARRGDSNESSVLGMQKVEAQYMALVRTKVRRVNEANMPRDWVATVLSDEVSAVFSVTLRRGGYIQSLMMMKDSGYRVLDGRAREAIYMASPFEGYPQNAGDTLTFTVIVYYTPSR